jgi:hypothetical protein
MAHDKLKSALIGAFVGGILGPGFALVILVFLVQDWRRETLLRNLIQAAFLAVRGWKYAFVAVGPAACLFGAACAVLLLKIVNIYISVEASSLLFGVGSRRDHGKWSTCGHDFDRSSSDPSPRRIQHEEGNV